MADEQANETTPHNSTTAPSSSTSNSTFSKLKNFASKVKKAALDTFDSTLEKIDAMVIDSQEDETKPFNWENKDSSLRCRQCNVTFNFINVFKRHCKLCGGVFCEECATYDLGGCSGASKSAATSNSTTTNDNTNDNTAAVDISYGTNGNQDLPRMCDGCRKGQTPSDRMMAIVEKLFVSGKHRFTFSKVPNPLTLQRGSQFGEDGSGLKGTSTNGPPSAGYFEIWNKCNCKSAQKQKTKF